MTISLASLPRDVLCTIFSFLTAVSDLTALRLTSRLMRDCLRAAPLQLSLGSCKNGDVSARLLARAFPGTVSVTLPTSSARTTGFTDETLSALAPLSRLETLDLSFASQLSNEAVRGIARFEHLTSLSLAGCLQVDDETLMALAGLSQVRFLSLLFLDSLTNTAIRKIGEAYSQLEELHLGNCYRVSDAGLACLPASLRVLNLQFVAVGDLGLEFLARVPALECLNLYGCRRVGNASLARLSALAELRLLSLGDTSLNDDGLKHVARLPRLQRLNLYALPGLTDSGLAALRPLSSLLTLDIEYCNISEDTALALAGALRVRRLNLHGCRASEGTARPPHGALMTSRCEMYCSWHLKRYSHPSGSLAGMYVF